MIRVLIFLLPSFKKQLFSFRATQEQRNLVLILQILSKTN